MAGDAISFEERVVLVTGAGSGLGRAYALELARRGALVVVNNRARGDQRKADAVADEIRAAGGAAVAETSSVATAEGGERAVVAAIEAFGRLDAVVLNAGGVRDRTVGKTTDEELEEVLGTHLLGAFHVARPAFRAMRERKYGRFVFVSSSAGLFGNFGQANYAAAKMGVVGLSSVVAIEGERQGIRSNVVAPLARTGPAAASLGPLADVLDPEAVAPLVAYLASEACTVTREVFTAGGGSFARVAVVRGRGWTAPEARVTAEDVRAHLDEIRDVARADEPRSFGDELELLGRELAARRGGGA